MALSRGNNLINGRDRQGPRALIDAYGTDDRVIPSSYRPLRVERLDTNGLDRRPSTMLWQNSDEEEFNWEAMRNVKARPSVGPWSGVSVESDIRNRWSSQGQPRPLPAHERLHTFLSTETNPLPPQLVNPNQFRVQGHVSSNNAGVSNPLAPPLFNFATNNVPNNTLHSQGRGFPPPPRGPPPLPSLQTVLPSHNAGPATLNQQPGNGFSGLISSLMAQGLISLTKSNPVQESGGLDFNINLLKVHHESALKALYGDLQRQCATCGLRFKGQEEHRSHMDWHVTKNRMSKNRKQKPSRKWFVSAAMWLSGAEALGTEAVPGFLPAEAVVEKKGDEEVAVAADESQNACALCGEQFEEFYSDETEEWMYRGAVYMNTLEGSTPGIDRGPIVHAKCRSYST